MLAALRDSPVNAAWQARMAELLDTPHDYSAAAATPRCRSCWQL